jgi:hypothetical protein
VLSVGALAKNGSFDFAKGRLVRWAKPNVPFVRWVFSMCPNGPRIGDSGGLESQNFQFYTKLSNSLLLISKFMKKGNIKRLLRQKKEKHSISPLNRHFANTMLCAGIMVMFV